MSIYDDRVRRRALQLCAVTGAALAGTFAFGAESALAAYTANVQHGTLQITGDHASDRLALRLAAGDPNTLQVDVGDDGTADFSFNRRTFTAIHVQGGAGNDQIRIDQSNGAFTDEAVTLDGGSGNDTLIGGDGADVLIGGSGDDQVTGGRGSDQAFLGSGQDTFTWNPGDGSDTVEGQDGHDAMQFNGANVNEQMTASANGHRVRFTRDVGNVTMDMNGIEDLNVRALGGADTLTVNDLTGTDLTRVNTDVGTGDGAADTVIANGTAQADHVQVSSAGNDVFVSGLHTQVQVGGSESANDHVQVNTLDGDDTVSTGVGTSGPASVDIDGGAGSDAVTYAGTSAADAISVAPNGSAVATTAPGTSAVNTTAVENLNVDGLGGDDSITGSNGLAGLTTLTLDGGSGNDTLVGGDGADVLLGGRGDDQVNGGRGSDVALLGNGRDTFTWNPGDGSDTVEGQRGRDAMQFNGANVNEQMSVSANGRRVRFSRDVANITMDMDGIEDLNVRALGGADTLTVNDLTGTDLRSVNADLSATGGGGDGAADTVIANGTAHADHVHVGTANNDVLVSGLHTHVHIAGSEAANDHLQINTLDGKDKVSVAPEVSQLIQAVVDLGAGQ
jgi:Ca2+-binding RTX toxin-like protein